MVTKFGAFLREIRRTHLELLKDMADKLGVSAAFLSSVETGKKSIPGTWEEALITHYNLNQKQKSEMREAIDQSARSATIDLTNQSAERRGVAVALARKFDGLTDEQLEMIKKSLFATTSRKKD